MEEGEIVQTEAPHLDTSVTIGVAAGTWETKAEHTGKSGMAKGFSQGGIVFSKAYLAEDAVSINVADDMRTMDHRIVVLDLDGKLHKPGTKSHNSAGQVREISVHFPNLRLDQIKSFQFQVRPYHWATFKNISLKEGLKTQVEIEQNYKSAGPLLGAVGDGPRERGPQVSKDTPLIETAAPLCADIVGTWQDEGNKDKSETLIILPDSCVYVIYGDNQIE